MADQRHRTMIRGRSLGKSRAAELLPPAMAASGKTVAVGARNGLEVWRPGPADPSMTAEQRATIIGGSFAWPKHEPLTPHLQAMADRGWIKRKALFDGHIISITAEGHAALGAIKEKPHG